MISKIGINIITKTAVEQDLYVRCRDAANYYEDSFEHGLKNGIVRIVNTFIPDVLFVETGSVSSYAKDGSVLNSVIIKICYDKGFNKRELRTKLNDYISNYFIKLFDTKA